MTTFEEDIVEVYYNLQGYFTMKNVPFKSIKKRKGGKGRGEFDLLAIKLNKRGKVEDAIRAEVSVGSSPFPFQQKSKSSTADFVRNKLLKKFFRNDGHKRIREIFGTQIEYRNIFVVSEFNDKTDSNLKKRLKEEKARIIRYKHDDKIKLEIQYKHKDAIKKRQVIEIIQFLSIMKELKKIFNARDLLKTNFQDPRLRGIQHMIKLSDKW